MIASLKEHGASRFPLSSYFCLTANEKDFSHSLEMMIGGKKGTLLSPLSPYGEGGDGPHSPSFRWKEVPRRGGGWLPQRDEKEMWGKRYSRISDYTDFSRRFRFCMPVEQPLEEGARRRRRIDLPRRGSLLREGMKGDVRIANPPVSSSKAEPRDLNVIAAFCLGEETQNFFVVSLSHSLRFTGVQGRFLASLEMTIWGKKTIRWNDGMRRSGILIFLPPQASCKLLSFIFTHFSFL